MRQPQSSPPSARASDGNCLKSGEPDPFATRLEFDLDAHLQGEWMQQFEQLRKTYPTEPLVAIENGGVLIKPATQLLAQEREAGCHEPIYPLYFVTESNDVQACWWTRLPTGLTFISAHDAEIDMLGKLEDYELTSHIGGGQRVHFFVPCIPDVRHLGTPLSRWSDVFDKFVGDEHLVLGKRPSAKQSVLRFVADQLRADIVKTHRLETVLVHRAETVEAGEPFEDSGPRDIAALKRLAALQEARYSACRAHTLQIAEEAKHFLQNLFKQHGGFFQTKRNIRRLSALVSLSVGATVEVSLVRASENHIELCGSLQGVDRFNLQVSPSGDGILGAERLNAALSRFSLR